MLNILKSSKCTRSIPKHYTHSQVYNYPSRLSTGAYTAKPQNPEKIKSRARLRIDLGGTPGGPCVGVGCVGIFL
jgi:hypothetical protein